MESIFVCIIVADILKNVWKNVGNLITPNITDVRNGLENVNVNALMIVIENIRGIRLRLLTISPEN